MEFKKNIPIYLQIMDKIKQEISIGELKLGEKLLSTRELASQLKVNPNTISRVYKELEREGIAFTRRGMGTFVTEDEEVFKHIRDKSIQAIFNKFITDISALGVTKKEIMILLENMEENHE